VRVWRKRVYGENLLKKVSAGCFNRRERYWQTGVREKGRSAPLACGKGDISESTKQGGAEFTIWKRKISEKGGKSVPRNGGKKERGSGGGKEFQQQAGFNNVTQLWVGEGVGGDCGDQSRTGGLEGRKKKVLRRTCPSKTAWKDSGVRNE